MNIYQMKCEIFHRKRVFVCWCVCVCARVFVCLANVNVDIRIGQACEPIKFIRNTICLLGSKYVLGKRSKRSREHPKCIYNSCKMTDLQPFNIFD